MLDEKEVSDKVIWRYTRYINIKKDFAVKSRTNHFKVWNEKEFFERFCLPKSIVCTWTKKLETPSDP